MVIGAIVLSVVVMLLMIGFTLGAFQASMWIYLLPLAVCAAVSSLYFWKGTSDRKKLGMMALVTIPF